MAVTINGSTGVQLDDNDKQKFGTGDDLEIFHDGSDAYISKTTADGRLQIKGDGIQLKSGSNNFIHCDETGIVELYHNATKQCETSANGLAFPSGKGIDFSAQTATSATGSTTTSELLDHYEEGTWTPVAYVYNSSAWVTLSFTSAPATNFGRYTRVGRQVFVSGRMVNFQANPSGASYAMFAGLPFTVSDYMGTGAISYTNAAFGTEPTAIQMSGNQVEFYVGPNWATWTSTANASVTFSATYMV